MANKTNFVRTKAGPFSSTTSIRAKTTAERMRDFKKTARPKKTTKGK
jgi:hypothetical protein